MQTVNVIGCAIDFSGPAHRALEMAADLARRYGATLTLVHVCDVPVTATTDVAVSYEEVAAAARREAELALVSCRADAERLAGKAVGCALLSGDAADAIVRWADGQRADLVVLGTHGRKGIRRLVLGSVAERVVRGAPCPVLVARSTPASDAD